MTKQCVRTRVETQLTEYFDGFVLVGKVAGEPRFVILHHPSPGTKESPAGDAGIVAALYDIADNIAGPLPKSN